MLRGYRYYAAGSVILILSTGFSLYAVGGKSVHHPMNEACTSCHINGEKTTPAKASLLISSQEKLCGKCHDNALTMSHPSGFNPTSAKAIPSAYPLDWKGDMTCSTCHLVHGNMPGMLRGTVRGREFCLSCHEQKFFDSMRDGGESVMASGHLGIPGSQNWQNLDPFSIQCMDCHESRGDVVIDPNYVARHGSQNHPVGSLYSDAEKYGGYRPAATLPKYIQLPNGRVSCVSCHETFTKNHGKLFSKGSITSLCFECHDI